MIITQLLQRYALGSQMAEGQPQNGGGDDPFSAREASSTHYSVLDGTYAFVRIGTSYVLSHALAVTFRMHLPKRAPIVCAVLRLRPSGMHGNEDRCMLQRPQKYKDHGNDHRVAQESRSVARTVSNLCIACLLEPTSHCTLRVLWQAGISKGEL